MNEELILTRSDTLSELVSKAVKKELDAREDSTTSNDGKLLTNRKAMDYLHVSRSTLQRWRNDGKLPFRKIQGKILYTISDIKKCLEAAQK